VGLLFCAKLLFCPHRGLLVPLQQESSDPVGERTDKIVRASLSGAKDEGLP